MSDISTIVIAGAGLAGAKAAEAVRKEGFDGQVILFGDEAHRPYTRPPLSKEYLRGDEGTDKVYVHPEPWYAEQRVDLEPATAVQAIDTSGRAVVLADGRRITFDRLLLATGSEARRLEMAGGDLDGVHYLRTIEDADALRDAALEAGRVAVIGGGWIGAEAAASIRQLGVEVTLIVSGSVPMERSLGTEVGAIYRDLHVERGVTVVANRRAVALHGRGRVEAVEITGGTRVEADLVVAGVGARPRTELAEAAGLAVGNGILVDERLETGVPGIFAAGDVAGAMHPLYGERLRLEHWDNARRQGRVAGRNMLGAGEAYARVPYLYSDQFDLGMEYAGHAPTWDRVAFRGDPASREFIAFWLLDGRVVAGMNANIWKVNDAISALVGSRERVDVGRLVDPAIPLAEVAGAAVT